MADIPRNPGAYIGAIIGGIALPVFSVLVWHTGIEGTVQAAIYGIPSGALIGWLLWHFVFRRNSN